jgi:hypothetical protein
VDAADWLSAYRAIESTTTQRVSRYSASVRASLRAMEMKIARKPPERKTTASAAKTRGEALRRTITITSPRATAPKR